MVISYPRDIPSCRAMQSEFRPRYFQARNVAGGGEPQVTQIAPPLWQGSWSVEVLDRTTGGEWEAWLESLRGGLRTFKGTPPKRRWPVAYPRGFAGLTVAGVAFTGNANLASIGTLRDTVGLSALPVGFVIKPGDFFSIPVGTKQHLHRVLEGGVAGAGGTLTLTVEPTIRPNATTAVAVKLFDPYCEMVLSSDWSSSRNGLTQSFSFSSLQVLF